jgi:hypothetical protein
VLASSCAAAQAQTQAVTTDSNVLITALSGVSAAFSMLVTYLAKETRNDVREMKPKVDVLWDRSERTQRPLQPSDVGSYQP